MMHEGFDIGGMGMESRFDSDTKQVEYRIHGSDNVITGWHPDISSALSELVGLIGQVPSMNQPMDTTYVMRLEQAALVLQQSTDKELGEAHGIMALAPEFAGPHWGRLAQMGSSGAGLALLAMMSVPPELRDAYLRGTQISVEGRVPDGGPQVITLTRDDGKWTFSMKQVGMTVLALDEQRSISGYALVPKAVEPVKEQLPVLPEGISAGLIDFQASFCAFRGAALQSLAELHPKGQAWLSEDVAPLLGFVAGMIRWFKRTGHHQVMGLDNPWYALALNLGSKMGLDTGDKIMGFAPSIFDKMAAMRPVETTDQVTCMNPGSCRNGAN